MLVVLPLQYPTPVTPYQWCFLFSPSVVPLFPLPLLAFAAHALLYFVAPLLICIDTILHSWQPFLHCQQYFYLHGDFYHLYSFED